MEHIPLPRGACVSEDERAPFVADVYDGGSWADYPQRSRFKALYDRIHPFGYPGQFVFHAAEASVPELEELFQTWLVFGSLHQVLGDMLNQDDFCEVHANGKKYLTTIELPGIMDKWVAANLDESRACDDDRLESFHSNFTRASIFLRKCNNVNNFSKSILWTTTLILESFIPVVHKTLTKERQHSLSLGWQGYLDLKAIASQMVRNGWCPTDAAVTSQAGAITATGLYYLSKLVQPPIKDHSQCSGHVCNAQKYDMDKGITLHRDLHCTCEMYHMDMPALRQTFDEGHFGLLDVSGEEHCTTVTASVVSSNAGRRYIAVSHVWSDGLGNPTANAIPRCQLAYLGGLLREIEAKCKTERLLLWLDSLCCPVDDLKRRQDCLLLMTKIYGDANAVLVLDSTLEYYNRADLDLYEVAVRLGFCGWTRRLWTFQEAFLASPFWIQFRDGPVGLTLNYRALKARYETPAMDGELLKPALSSLSVMTQRRVLAFDNIYTTLGRRSVSVASDEALCLCTLLEMDRRLVVDSLPENRTQALWSTVKMENKFIDKSFPFFEGPRLEIAGLRWAPSSFLDGRMKSTPKVTNERAIITPAGLVAEYLGLEFRLYCNLSEQCDAEWQALKKEPHHYYIRVSEIEWYCVFYDWEPTATSSSMQALGSNSQGTIALLTTEARLETISIERVSCGLVGSFIDTDSDAMGFHPGIRVSILRENASMSYTLESCLRIGSAKPGKGPKDDLRGIAREELGRDPTLLKYIARGESEVSNAAVADFAAWLRGFYAGRMGEVTRIWPATQKWCLD